MKKRFLFMGLAAVVAVSSMRIGFASWKTDAAGTGKVSASGKWDISVTDAALEAQSSSTLSTASVLKMQRLPKTELQSGSESETQAPEKESETQASEKESETSTPETTASETTAPTETEAQTSAPAETEATQIDNGVSSGCSS